MVDDDRGMNRQGMSEGTICMQGMSEGIIGTPGMSKEFMCCRQVCIVGQTMKVAKICIPQRFVLSLYFYVFESACILQYIYT